MRKLDRSKPYGEVFGATDDGHRFEQNGIKFGPDGVEMVLKITTPPVQEQIAIPPREYNSAHPWELSWRVFGEEPGEPWPVEIGGAGSPSLPDGETGAPEKVVVPQETGNLFEQGGSATGKSRGGRTPKQ